MENKIYTYLPIINKKVVTVEKTISDIKIGNNLHYIYLIRRREYVLLEQIVYKIGKTTQDPPYKRIRAYDNGHSEIFLLIKVGDCHELENRIKDKFKQLFTQKKDIGTEYFEGDAEIMIKHIFTICFTDN